MAESTFPGGAAGAVADLIPKALAFNNLALVSPQATIGYQPDFDETGVAGLIYSTQALLFHYEAENSVNLRSDITDHFIEDNSSIVDHIGLQPETIIVRGFVGELNDVPTGVLKVLKAATEKLTILSAYTPSLSISAQNAYNLAFQTYSLAMSINKTVMNAMSYFADEGLSVIGSDGFIQGSLFGTGTKERLRNQNLQQSMFQMFYGYWRKRTIFKVQTPWAVFLNCAIQSLTATQNQDTTEISEFEVTFKVLRFAKTSITPMLSGRSEAQSALQPNFAKLALSLWPDSLASIQV